MEAGLIRLNQSPARQNLPAVGLRMGIYSGKLIAGSVGNSRHLEYTVHGDSVNLAARLEGWNKADFKPVPEKPCRILVGDTTARHAQGYFEMESLGAHQLTVGRVGVFKVTGMAGC
jgi:adenylate cyclase